MIAVDKFTQEADLEVFSTMESSVSNEPLPLYYTDAKEWPQKMSAACPVCRYQDDVVPKTIIMTIEKTKCSHNGLQFNLWGCAAFFIKYFMNNDQRLKLNLVWLYNQFEPEKRLGEIEPVQPPWLMTMYGGPLSKNEWTNVSNSDDMKTEQIIKNNVAGNLVETPDLTNPETHAADVSNMIDGWDLNDEFII